MFFFFFFYVFLDRLDTDRGPSLDNHGPCEQLSLAEVPAKQRC